MCGPRGRVNDAAVCPTGNTMPDKTVARARKTTTAGRKHQTSIYAGYEPKPPPLCKDVKEIRELIQAIVK